MNILKQTKFLLLLLLCCAFQSTSAWGLNFSFIDEANLIANIKTQANVDNKQVATITMKVWSRGKEDNDNLDPFDTLVLIKDDSSEFIMIEAKKVAPGVFVAENVPSGKWEIQTPDLNGAQFDRGDVDREHVH